MKKVLFIMLMVSCTISMFAQENVIDEIVWVVGDDAILRSDVESQRLYMQNEGQRFLEGLVLSGVTHNNPKRFLSKST